MTTMTRRQAETLAALAEEHGVTSVRFGGQASYMAAYERGIPQDVWVLLADLKAVQIHADGTTEPSW